MKTTASRMAEKVADVTHLRDFNSIISVCRMLEKRHFNTWEQEMILRSGWIAAAVRTFGVKGRASSGTLAKYLDKYSITSGCKDVNEGVMTLFGKEHGLELNAQGVPCRRGHPIMGRPGSTILVPVGTPMCCDPTTETYASA